MSDTIAYVNECCGNDGFREDGPGPRGWNGIEGLESRDDTAVTHCSVCECRHVEAAADTGHLGLVGKAL